MLLQSIYDDFTKHTGLFDSVYKTVFINLSEILDKIKDIKFLSLSYTLDSKVAAFDFVKQKTVPLYLVEIINNLFENFYTFPTNCTIELLIDYKQQVYKIEAVDGLIRIPDQIQFIKDNHLFGMFYLTKEIDDIFLEFDRFFKFTNFFKNKTTSIYEPLKKQFEIDKSSGAVIEGNVRKRQILGDKALLENLQARRDVLLSELSKVSTALTEAFDKKNKLALGISSRGKLLIEEGKLKADNSIMKEIYQDCLHKKERIEGVLEDINKEISHIVENNIEDGDIEYLKEKKTVFEAEKTQVEKSLLDSKSVSEATDFQLKNISQQLATVLSYNQNDIDTVDKQINDATKNQENLYANILGIEAEVKNLRSNILKGDLTLSQAGGGFDTMNQDIKRIESSSIVEHIASNQQPSSVITVLNYLRYYFAYHVTNIFSLLEANDKNLSPSILQAVACRIAMTSVFGIYVQLCFSIIDFVDSRHGKVVTIVKE